MLTNKAIEFWPVEKLVPYIRNPRKNDAAVTRMVASLNEYGFKTPMLVRSDGEIVDGHLRLKAALKLGMPEVPIIRCDEWTEAQVKAFRLLVNRSATWAEWDEELLAIEFGELAELNFDPTLTGFDPSEIDVFMAANGAGDDGQVDSIPEVLESPISVRGDLWLLGDHKLLVGDATSSEDVDRLMAGHRADLILTDPPYNVDYAGYTEGRLTIQGDCLTAEEFRKFLTTVCHHYRRIANLGASLYICHASSWQREFQNALEKAGFEIRCQIIWAKNTFAWGFGRYKFQHEPIFFCHIAGQKDAWYGDKSQSTLWPENKPAANRMHPTAKPVELMERALINSSKAGDLVVDLFGGSGSTLVACERRGRKSRLMEIDPKYADCIVRRWQQYTGKQAVLDADGRSFDDLAQERVGAVVCSPPIGPGNPKDAPPETQ